MQRLRDGTLITVWTRAIVASHPDHATATVDVAHAPVLKGLALGRTLEAPEDLAHALGEHLVDGEPTVDDPVMQDALRELDERYVGWLPGFFDNAADLIARVEGMHARRRLLTVPRLARPSLPASTAKRAQVLSHLDAETIFLDDDIDGMSVLMAERAEVTVFEPCDFRRAWLEAEARRAGVDGKLTLMGDAPETGSFDLAVIHSGPAVPMARALERAVGLTKVGGRIATSVRAPWEDPFLDQIEAAGLSVEAYHREVDHWVAPGPLVIDGAGDLAIVDRPAKAQVAPVSEDSVERFRLRPYFNIDIDDLAVSRFGERFDDVADRLVTAIAARAPRPEAMRSVLRDKQRFVIGWFDESGVGLSAELRLDEAHIMVTLMPYDVELEHVVLSVAYEILADRYTRARPIRTRRWQQEGIFG
ncbi:MAG: hypothetical protein V3T05_06555 [Myxococcota bacterium]